jgi:hypothetical protein
MSASPVLAGLLGCALAFGAGVGYGTGVGEDREYAKRAREDRIVADTRAAAQQAAAEEIARIKQRNVTLRQETEREIQTRVEYRDCTHPDGVLRNINEALTGRRDPAGTGGVP